LFETKYTETGWRISFFFMGLVAAAALSAIFEERKMLRPRLVAEFCGATYVLAPTHVWQVLFASPREMGVWGEIEAAAVEARRRLRTPENITFQNCPFWEQITPSQRTEYLRSFRSSGTLSR